MDRRDLLSAQSRGRSWPVKLIMTITMFPQTSLSTTQCSIAHHPSSVTISLSFLRILSVHHPPKQEARNGKRNGYLRETFFLIRSHWGKGERYQHNTHTKVGIARFFLPQLDSYHFTRVKSARKDMFFEFGELRVQTNRFFTPGLQAGRKERLCS